MEKERGRWGLGVIIPLLGDAHSASIPKRCVAGSVFGVAGKERGNISLLVAWGKCGGLVEWLMKRCRSEL